MRKLVLDLDTLTVDTFAVADESTERGTILAHAVKPSVSCPTTLEGCETAETCGGDSGAFTCQWDCSAVCVSFDWHLFTCGC